MRKGNRRRLKTVARATCLTLAAAMALQAAGCSFLAGMQLAGTWQAGTGANTQTWVFGFTTASYTVLLGGMTTGSMNLSIQECGGGHILMTVVSASGSFSSYPPSTVVYATYDIKSDSLWLSYLVGGAYPLAAAGGPFVRQGTGLP
jgi:hypothetical protein